MSDGIDLRFRRSNQTFGTSLSFENDILSLLNNRGDILSSVNIDLIKKEELPTANEDNLGVIYLYTGPDDEYKHGYFYECVENSGVYSWENIIVQDSYLKSETYNKTEVDTELAKKLNTDGSNTFTGVLKMRASVSFKGAIAPSWKGIGIYELKDDDSVSLMASMEKIDGFTPADNNTYNIGVNSRKWKDLYLAGKAYISTINNGGDITIPTVAGTMALTSDLTNFADKDLSNLTSQGKNIANWSSNISNCITEIPQDIKLELNNGVLTLKAGSKIYVPNGFESDGTTPKFNVVTIANDITSTGVAYDGDCFYFVDGNGTSFTPRAVNQCVTFTTIPTSAISDVYEGFCLEDNKMYVWSSQNNTWIASGKSLPIGIINLNSTSPYNREIKQVFNGFGYIGKRNFITNAKFLIAKGYNTDGTYHNQEYIINSPIVAFNNFLNNTIMFFRNNDEYDYQIYNISEQEYLGELDYVPNISPVFQWYYNTTNRMWYMHDASEQSWRQVDYINLGINTSTETKFKEVFRALDYNDTSYIASQSFPGDRYIDLTLGASGTTYTAPADGYIQMIWDCGSGTSYITVDQPFNADQIVYNVNYTSVGKMFKVRKGNFKINYTNITATTFRFVYAKGEV